MISADHSHGGSGGRSEWHVCRCRSAPSHPQPMGATNEDAAPGGTLEYALPSCFDREFAVSGRRRGLSGSGSLSRCAHRGLSLAVRAPAICSNLFFCFGLGLGHWAAARLAQPEDRAEDLALILAVEAAAEDAILRHKEGHQDADGPQEHANARELSVARTERVLRAVSARGATTNGRGQRRPVCGKAARAMPGVRRRRRGRRLRTIRRWCPRT